MRSDPPSTERFLWRLLRKRQVAGLRFRRQVVIGPYTVDFACFDPRLVIEADGPFHDPVKDSQRDAWLTAQGFRVLRLANSTIMGNANVLLGQLEAFACHPLDESRLDFSESSVDPNP